MHHTKRRRLRRATKADNAALQEAFHYLTSVKQVFASQPEVPQEFTALLRDFKERRVEAEYVIGRVRKLFTGHPELIYGFRVFLPPGETNQQDLARALHLLEAPCYDGEPEAAAYPSPIGSGCPVSICARCPGLLGMDPLGLCPYPAPGPGPWAVTAALPTPTAAELVAQPLYNTFVSVRLLRRLHIAAEPIAQSRRGAFAALNHAAQVPLASLSLRFLDRGAVPRVPKRRRLAPPAAAAAETDPVFADLQLDPPEATLEHCLSATPAEPPPAPHRDPEEDAGVPAPASSPRPRRPLPRELVIARRLERLQHQPEKYAPRAQRLRELYPRPTEADAERLLDAMRRADAAQPQSTPETSMYARAMRIFGAYTRSELPACRVYVRLRRLFQSHPTVVDRLRPFFPGVAPASASGQEPTLREPKAEIKAEIKPFTVVAAAEREEASCRPLHELRRREKSPRAAKPTASHAAPPRHSPIPKPPPRSPREEAQTENSEVPDIFGHPYLGEEVDIPPPFGASYFKNNRPRRMYCKAQTDGNYDDLGRANLNILFECAAPSAENRDRGEGYTKESREELLQYQAWDRLFSLDVAIQQCEGTITFLSQLLGNPTVVGRGPPTEDQPGSSARRPFWKDIYKVTLRRVFGSAQVVKEILEEIAERPESAVPKVIVKLQMRKKEHLMDRTQLAARLHSASGL